MGPNQMDAPKADKDPRVAMDSDLLAEANRRASPQITVASSFTPGVAAGVCGIGLLGILTFSSLAANRTDVQPTVASPAQTGTAVDPRTFPNAQVLVPVRPPERPPVLMTNQNSLPPSLPTFSPTPIPGINTAQMARLQSPTIVVDLSRGSVPTEAVTAMKAGSANAQGLGQTVAGEERDVARAGRLGDPSFTVPEGTALAGTLETAINSDLPGHVRAIVSRNVTSFDGSQILIPKGSRLVGQYQSSLAVGQRRTFIIWERLIRPDGVTIALASPGTDSLGRAGVTGKVHSHFLRRFGAALLMTVIDAGTRAATAGSGNVVISGAAGSTAGVAGSGLQNDINIPPTIKVQQGTAIRIVLNRDLDFSGVGPASTK